MYDHPEPSIETTRSSLEPLLPRHADALFEGLQHPALYEHIDDRPPASRAALEERYRRLARRRSPDGLQLWLNWAVLLRETSTYLGYVQATVHPDRTAEIAYVLFASAWGRGYATEAAGAMIAWLRDRHHVATLLARADPRNVRSIALLERLAFMRCASSTGAHDGDASNDVIYRL